MWIYLSCQYISMAYPSLEWGADSLSHYYFCPEHCQNGYVTWVTQLNLWKKDWIIDDRSGNSQHHQYWKVVEVCYFIWVFNVGLFPPGKFCFILVWAILQYHSLCINIHLGEDPIAVIILITDFCHRSDGTVVPMGPPDLVVPKTDTSYSLLYNEYIVYNPAQVRTRFLLKVKFNFK